MNDKRRRLIEQSNYRLDRRTEATLHLVRLQRQVDEAKTHLKELLKHQKEPPLLEENLPRWVRLMKGNTPTKDLIPDDIESKIERAKKRVSDMEDQYYRVSRSYSGRY